MYSAILGPLIAGLDEVRFVELCNALIRAAAASAGIPQSCIRTTRNTKAGDEGVDARCIEAPATSGALIPHPDVAYQFKAGLNIKSAAKIAEKDIIGEPGIRAALLAGHAVVYISAEEPAVNFEQKIIEEVRKREADLLTKGRIVFIGRDTLAGILQSYPALVAEFLRLEQPLFSLDDWSRLERLSNPFRTNGELDAQLAALCEQAAAPGARLSVVGPAGSGKTRLVLEALRSPELAPVVLYAKHPDDVKTDFLAVLRTRQDIQCIVVVDEVENEARQNLVDRFSPLPPGVRLITIGRDATGQAPPQSLVVKGLDEELLIAIINAIVPGLPDSTAKAIAQACERSPKLAVTVAQQIRANPDLAAPRRVLSDPTIRGVLDQYLGFDEEDVRWSALSAVALLERVGWTREVEGESEVLFRAVGLAPAAARSHVERLHDRLGIAPLAGRFRYVSPSILADHLAERQLRSWTGSRLREVLGQFTPAMADSLAGRMRRLAAVLKNRWAVEGGVLGAKGLFRTLADLEAGGLHQLLPRLAGAFPAATLRALERVIRPASDTALRAATRSRRDVVWALEQLLWREDTFPEAAALLLRLAATENDTWGNNATGLWGETFRIPLGRTAAGHAARTAVLKRAASSHNPAERVLAAMALGGALQVGSQARAGGPPEDVEGMPEEAWWPRTYDEWSRAIETYLTLLTPLLRDPDGAARRQAAEALANGVEAAVNFPVTEAWISAARTLREADYELRAIVLERLDDQLDRSTPRGEVVAGRNEDGDAEGSEEAKAGKFKTELRRRAAALAALGEELRGADFSSRLRYAVTRTAWADARARRRPRSEAAALAIRDRLAEEVVRQPALLDGEWDWLLAQPVPAPERWAELLGKVDRDRALVPTLERLAAQHPRAVTWLSLYEVAYATARQDDSVIDGRAEELRAAGAAPTRIFDLLWHAGYTPTRLRQVLDLLESRAVPGDSIRYLIWAQWMLKLTEQEAVRLARAAAQDPAAAASVIAFINQFLHTKKDARETFRDIAIQLLCGPGRATEAGLGEYEWSWLAREYAADAPIEIAAAVLERVANRRHRADDSDVAEILRRVWHAGDKERLFVEVFGPWLEAGTRTAWWVRDVLEKLPLGDLGADRLARWVAENPERRARRLAEVLGAPGGRLSDAHAMLLERYGPEGVGNVFFAAYVSGTSWGPRSAWLRRKLADAREWLADERPACQEWARGVSQSLEAMIHEAEHCEAEDRFW